VALFGVLRGGFWGGGGGAGVLGREYFRCILCLSQDRRVWGITVASRWFSLSLHTVN